MEETMQDDSEGFGEEEAGKEGLDRPSEEYGSLEYNRINSPKYKESRRLWKQFLNGEIDAKALERLTQELSGEYSKNTEEHIEKIKDVFGGEVIW